MPKVSPAPSSPAKGLLRANLAVRDAPVERGRSRTCIRGGERSRRQYFYIHQDYCIQEAWRRFQYDLQREDFRRLDNAGNQRYIDGVAQAYDTYAANWSILCAELPGLAIVVPVAKGGTKGQGKGKGKQQQPADRGQARRQGAGAARSARRSEP